MPTEIAPQLEFANWTSAKTPLLRKPLSIRSAFNWIIAATACFHLAYGVPKCGILIVGYLFCLLQLPRLRSGRQAFYLGLVLGMATVAPQLSCFWSIFGPGSIALWLVLSLWIAFFTLISQTLISRYSDPLVLLLLPFIWTGLEYFRSELYYLRFSWMNIGYAFADSVSLTPIRWFGIYGVGTLAAGMAITLSVLRSKYFALASISGILLLAALLAGTPRLFRDSSAIEPKTVEVAGVQMEFPDEAQVLHSLDKLIEERPNAQLFMLSEYTFDGPIPAQVTRWCKEHQRYLVAGGKAPATNENYFNTAFVIGPDGEIVFQQVKSVPIQFFKDGRPAPEQKLWDSPWGKIGICICYDLSYTLVTDRLIRMGAQAILVPTMDVIDWGVHQHKLHARVAEIRAAEYGVPIFRLASSGISQVVDRTGAVLVAGDTPGQEQIIGGSLTISRPGIVPGDRWLARFSVAVLVATIFWLLSERFRSRALGPQLLKA